MGSLIETPEEQLLSEAIAGQFEALSELLRRHGTEIRQKLVIGRQWQNVLDADDMMQVTYLESFLQIRHFVPGQSGSFAAWLRRIAENNLRDAIKSLERAKRPPPGKRVESPSADNSAVGLYDQLCASSATPSRIVNKRDIHTGIDAAIRQLPNDYATVIRLYDLEGRAVSDVAAALQRSPGAVHMLRARAHDRLREILGNESQFFSRQG